MKKLLAFAAVAALVLTAPLASAAAAKPKAKKKPAAAAPSVDNDQFKKLDSNSDGKLSLDEFKAMFEAKATSKGKKGGPDPFKLFAQLDANSDNSLSLTEFKNLKPSDLQPEPKKKK